MLPQPDNGPPDSGTPCGSSTLLSFGLLSVEIWTEFARLGVVPLLKPLPELFMVFDIVEARLVLAVIGADIMEPRPTELLRDNSPPMGKCESETVASCFDAGGR